MEENLNHEGKKNTKAEKAQRGKGTKAQSFVGSLGDGVFKNRTRRNYETGASGWL